MSNGFESIDVLIDGVKGTTNILSSLISRKSGLVILFLIFAVIASKLLLG